MSPAKLKKNRARYEPKNKNQELFRDAIIDNDVVFGLGPAGVGKTYVSSMEAAIAFEETEVNKIIIIRPAREVLGENLGFLPGSMEEKIAPFLYPIFDVWNDIWQPEKVEQMMEDKDIEAWSIAHLRGRTFKKSFVILDEIQNLTHSQLYLVLTRLGEGSKLILSGDFEQCDLKNSERTCFDLVKALIGTKRVSHVYFSEDDIERHDTVTEIVKVYNEYFSLKY